MDNKIGIMFIIIFFIIGIYITFSGAFYHEMAHAQYFQYYGREPELRMEGMAFVVREVGEQDINILEFSEQERLLHGINEAIAYNTMMPFLGIMFFQILQLIFMVLILMKQKGEL